MSRSAAAGPGRQRRRAIVFLLTCAFLLSTVFVITGLRPVYYDENPVDFAAMRADEYALTSGLSDDGIPRIKLAYLDQAPPPRVALFGHHIVRSMSRDAFPFDADTAYFFNYYFTHVSLPEVRDMLRYQERTGRLPKELALVYVSHPYIGLQMLTDYRWVLPLEFYLNSISGPDSISMEKIRFVWDRYLARMQFRLDWKHAAYALITTVLQGGCQKFGIYRGDEGIRSIELPGWITGLKGFGLGSLVNRFAHVYKQDCQAERIRGLRGDGSFFGPYTKHKMASFDAVPADMGAWSSESVERIRKIAKEIHEIGRRNDLTIAFFIPPLLRKYFPHAGHEHFDELTSLLRADGILVFDHRRLLDTDYFLDDEHVSDRYFRLLIDDLDARGLLPKPAQRSAAARHPESLASEN